MNIDDLFFEPAVSRHVDQANFIARSWLVDRIERHLTDPDCRFILVTGEPGVGKSSVIAWLARRHPDSLRYFIRSDSVSLLASGSTRAVLTTLGHQLAVRQPTLFTQAALDISVEQHADNVPVGGRLVGIHAGELATSPFWPTLLKVRQQAGQVAGDVVGIEADRIVADENLIALSELERIALRDPAIRLATIEPKQQILILLDALDELRFQPTDASLMEWLASCAELPANVRIVLSARPDHELLARFRSAKYRWLREELVNPREPLARNDVESYMLEALSARPIAMMIGQRGIQVAGLAARLSDRAAGNFQYATAYVAAIKSAARGDGSDLGSLITSDELPPDLNALYSFFLTLIMDAIRDMRVPARDEGWQPAWPGIYQPLLAILAIARAPISPYELAALAGLDVAPEWLHDALGRLGQFLNSRGGLIQLYHASIAEFLTSAQTRELRPSVYVDATSWNQRLVQHSMAWYENRWDVAGPYVRRHLASHAVAIGSGALSALVQNADFLAAADPATLSPLLSFSDPELRSVIRIYRRARPLLGDDLHANAAYLQEAASALVDTGISFDRIGIRPLYRTLLTSVRPDGSILTLTGHTKHLHSVAFGADADGRALLASASDDGTVRLWDPAAEALAGPPFTGHSGPVNSVAFGADADGRALLASASDDGTVRLWDPATGASARQPLTGHTKSVMSVAFGRDADGRTLLASGDYDGIVRLWDLVTGLQSGAPLIGHSGYVNCVTFVTGANDRALLASTGHDGTVRLWDPATGAQVGLSQVARGRERCRALASGIDAAGQPLLASGDTEGIVRLHYRLLGRNPAPGYEPELPLTGHTRGVNAVAFGFNEDGRAVLASGSDDGTIRLWDPITGRSFGSPLTGHTSGVNALAFGVSTGGKTLLASGGHDGTVRLWDMADSRQTEPPPTGPVRSVAFGTAADGGKLLAFGSDDGKVRLWDLVAGREARRPLVSHIGEVRSVAFGTAAGRALLASGGHDGTVRLCNLATRHQIRRPRTKDFFSAGLPEPVQSVAFGLLGDGRSLLAYGGFDGITLWNPVTGKHDRPQPPTAFPEVVWSLTFCNNAEGQNLLAYGSNSTVHIWNFATGEAGPPLVAGRHFIYSLAYGVSSDGRALLASGDMDGTVRLWDLSTGGYPISLLNGHEGPVRSTAFGVGADGRPLLASGGEDRTIRLWDPATELCLATLHRRSYVYSIAFEGSLLAIGEAEGVTVIDLDL